MQDSSTVFIIDLFNRYHKNDNVRFTFPVNDEWYCIREVPLDWGQPQFPEKDIEDNYTDYCLYPTYEDALNFVKTLNKIREL